MALQAARGRLELVALVAPAADEPNDGEDEVDEVEVRKLVRLCDQEDHPCEDDDLCMTRGQAGRTTTRTRWLVLCHRGAGEAAKEAVTYDLCDGHHGVQHLDLESELHGCNGSGDTRPTQSNLELSGDSVR